MAATNTDICIRIILLNPQGQPLGGTVDLEFKPQTVGSTVDVKGVDASKNIDVSGLQRTPQGLYQLTVTPTDVFKPASQFVTIPASGFVTVTIVIDKGTGTGGGSSDICIRVIVLNPQGQPLGGTVNLEFKPQAAGSTVDVKGADASKNIDVSGLQRAPQGLYQLTVTPTDVSKPASQFVTIPAGGFATATIVIDKGTGGQTGGPNILQGNLVFDNGLLAAAITVRLYNVAFGGQDAKLGEVKSDAQGKYSISYSPLGSAPPSLQVRVLDSTGKEVTISATKYNASQSETLNLVVPVTVQPLPPEFQRLAADMGNSIGGIANLGVAQEGAVRQDLTLLNQSTNWDARLVALAATAAQQTAVTGLGHDVLYALLRVGLPSDPSLLATVPAATVQKALSKANQAGIVSLNDQQIAAATTTFQNFASQTLVASTTAGAVSSFHELLTPMFQDPAQQTAFANLYFSLPPTSTDLWSQAANLQIPAATLDTLKLQGKFLYLTFNNAALAGKLQQDVGSLANVAQIADKDYHQPAKWKDTLVALAGTGGDKALQALIPAIYPGVTTNDRLTAYTADLARKVRISFPTQVTARMIENKEIAAHPDVPVFLRAASAEGYSLGRTPLNAFLNNSGKSLPALDDSATQSLKTLHRLFQVTPSTESLQAAMTLGFTSANHIASYSQDEFMDNYAYLFPQGEAQYVYGQAQTVSSVTFNCFALAKQLDNSAPIYALSSSGDDRQNAKNTLVQQFPSMASLFGNLDFCQCEDCRSVLSPAAYFVDVLDLLGKNSAVNSAGFTPLDVLIGGVSKDVSLSGRRPDLGALPLTCENTNTAMPYIDLVNEILEYYIAHSGLDSNAAYDTGSATTADLTAEPQHILPDVYSKTLKQAVYPLNLPFDLWIETVRGFLNYFRSPLAQVLDTLRPADTLELFTSIIAPTPYYRAQILAEALGISPAEYAVFTVFDTTKWFDLYGTYPNEAAALSDLKSAKTLSQRLGVTYQDLVDLMTTGFLNPALYPLLFQFERFGIDIGDAFSFTGQPGYPALSAQDAANFGALLDGITTRYKANDPAFNARTWLASVLPANYSTKVLVLADPDTGCNFTGTTLQYADGSPAAALDFLKFNLFVRLWKKLGWNLDEIDRALQAFFPPNLPAFSDVGFATAFGGAWKTALVYLAHLDDLNTRLAPALGRLALLPLWTALPTQGETALYAQLFLTASVLNNDFAFDDPNGQFPSSTADPLSAHQAAVQGVLSLTSTEIVAILSDAGVAGPALFSLANLSICYRYSLLAQCLQLSVSDMIALKTMSGLNPFQAIAGTPLNVLADDILLNQTLAFVKQVVAVQNSGFTVEDLKYLLRQQFDPVGKYQSDANALIALSQTVGAGLRQIQTQNAVPPSLPSLSESLIDQILSGLFPAAILKTLFTQLTNSQTYTASAPSLAPVDPAPFAQEPELTFSYDAVTQTQTIGYKGLLLDWNKADLETINGVAPFPKLLDAVQLQAQAALTKSVGDILGVWASLVQYEEVKMPVPLAAAITDPLKKLAQADASLSFSYDESDQLQWLGYRGVLTSAKQSVLTGIDNSPTLAALLTNVQQQALPAYSELVGSLLAMWANVQTYAATQAGVEIDASAFSAALALAQQNGAITGPVPVIQFSYDSGAGIQTLTCQGVLTDATRALLAPLIPAPLLAGLLQTVRDRAVQLFQSLAAGLLTLGPNDLDKYSAPFLGVDPSKQQKPAKAELVKVFLPLLARKLSRQLVLQTLSANLGSDPSLTEALITDAALLNDPTNPGISLLGAFLSVGQQGVSAAYYTSANQTGIPTTGTAATTDTADATNSVPGTASCHFEGYLQVSTDGPYRFFAELGNLNAQVTFHLDSPDPTVLFANPTIQQTAAKDGDEASQFVQLKGGVAYHFALDFLSLGAGGASLLIQGETLPKGPLSQVVLFPQDAISGFIRANVLLSKVLQILQVTGLDEREVSYMTANAAQFSNLKLSALPTQASDDSVANAVALFAQFLTLADYADLRKGPAGGADGLVDVFQAASQSSPATPPWTILANLTRRDSQVVQDLAAALGPDPHFLSITGIRRMWDALQLLQIVGLPVASLSAVTAIVAGAPAKPDAIAANFKNAVKAQYTADQWRPIAKSVFDPLRRKKRDALVAYLINEKGFNDSNQLFEYFLVDPGMEPVVQTSRLRLAMSSVQTFVQRCLLNLENGNTSEPARNVAPSAIRADWWEWMKRYRVWEANREIFLFPENWMEPELRLDKTDLFQALEGELLQGDVTRDLVEDAFLTYLKGLDVRARLDVVANYLDQDTINAGLSTLYVLGRTYGHPHKYFYRTYSTGTWSGWEAVPLDIESNHIVLVIWRGRLNIFWLTFINKAQGPGPSGSGGSKITDIGFNDLTNAMFGAKARPQVQVQLHWSEYVQGKWSKPIASDVNRYAPVNTFDSFTPDRDIYIHVSKEIDASGNEGAVKIHLDINLGGGNGICSFRVTSKNSDPDFNAQYYEGGPDVPYNTYGVDATLHTGSDTLVVYFESQIGAGSSTFEHENILNKVNNFAISTCANPIALPFSTNPAYWDGGGLVTPFFFKDTSNPDADSTGTFRDERTFFVQPSLTETVIDEWYGWAIGPSVPTVNWYDPSYLDTINVIAQVPVAGPIPPNPGDPVYSVFPMQNLDDWATNPAVAISYGGVSIGKSGGIQAGGLSAGIAAGVPIAGITGLTFSPGPIAAPSLTIVGKQGLSLSQVQNFQSVKRGSPAANITAVSLQRKP